MKIINSIIDCFDEIINNHNNIDMINEEKIMSRKIYEHKRGNSPYDKNRFERHPTLGQNKINPSKTFNKSKGFLFKNNSNAGNIFAKSFGKQKSSMENQKNNIFNIIEKKNTGGMIRDKKNINISNFNEKLPIIPNAKIEIKNEEISQINNHNILKK